MQQLLRGAARLAITSFVHPLSSGKLALVLILLLILFSLAGAILPQEGRIGAAELARWQIEHPLVTRIVEPLGLFDAFHCPPFLATIVLLAVNTLTCTVLCLKRQGGFRGLDGPATLRRTGFLLLHLSLILLFAGGFLSAAAELEGRIILTEGQEFTDTHDNYRQLHEGPLRKEGHTALTVRLQEVHIRYEKQRFPVAVASKLEMYDGGKRVAEGLVEVNKPFDYGGLTFTHDKTGFSPRIEIRDARGRLLADSFVALQTFRSEAGSEYRDFLPLPFLKRRIVVSLYPSFTRVAGEARKTGDVPDDPMLLMTIEDPIGKVVERHELKIGERTTIGRHTFAFTELRRWASFRVAQDPGYPLVWTALWIGLVSLVVRYLPDLRVWLREWAPPAPVATIPPPPPHEVPDGVAGDMIRSAGRRVPKAASAPAAE